MLIHYRHRLLLPVVALMTILLVGCQSPSARQAPAAPAPAPSSSNPTPAPTAAANNPLAFTRTELLTGKEISFPADSAGRVAVLLFFSTG